jgi:hypothetical protein
MNRVMMGFIGEDENKIREKRGSCFLRLGHVTLPNIPDKSCMPAFIEILSKAERAEIGSLWLDIRCHVRIHPWIFLPMLCMKK